MQVEYEIENINNVLSYSQDKKYLSWNSLSAILDQINPIDRNDPSKKSQ